MVNVALVYMAGQKIVLCEKFICMKKFAFLITVLLIISATWQSCQTTKSSTATKMLKFNLEKNKGYDYELTLNMDQEIMGQQIQMDMGVYYSMDVISDDGYTKTITSSIERFKMKTGAAGMNYEVDTDKPYTA
jgi:hypothetical protein